MTATDTVLEAELDLNLTSEVRCECIQTGCHHQHGSTDQRCRSAAVYRLRNQYQCRHGCDHDVIEALCECCLEDVQAYERTGWAHIVRLMKL
ncbi:hypothetical protein [Brevibacterium sp.]|uniref:hypothetical protein n=1 Tax=Brevibacterium sp. TaxID=1701 RepID=UPI0025C2453F|nr:hypothetical protein [Brevibacterium sp.]